MVSALARKNLEAHIKGERAQDLSALLAPLSETVSYVVPDYVLHGRAAIAEMYRRVMPSFSPALADEYLRALDDPTVARWGDNHCVLEYSEAYPLHRGMVVIIHFEGDHVKSENTYFATTRGFMAARAHHQLGDIPGAIPIDSDH